MKKKSTILITGASKGIGLLTAQALAAKGHQVFASMRDMTTKNKNVADSLRSFSEQISGQIIPIELDVTSEQSANSAITNIEADQPIDVLINNAGVMPVGLTEAYTLSQVKDYFDVNFYGIVNTTRAILPFMRERKKGRLVHLSSSAGRLALPYFGVYCASKWAVEAYAESIHYELAPYDIDTCIVEPSGHATGLVTSSPRPNDSGCLDEYGPVAHGGEKLLAMFKDSFAKAEPETDAQNVADCLVDLVEQNHALPLRFQIGSDMGVTGINDAIAPIQQGVIDQLKPIYQEVR